MTEEHDVYYEIKYPSRYEGEAFMKIRPTTLRFDDEKFHVNTLIRKTSTKSTGKAFINVQPLCKELFGPNQEDWARDFKKQGETEDGFTLYRVI